MKYEVNVEDVEGDQYYPEADIPDIEAATPWDAFKAAVEWCRANNVMPTWISVDPSDASDSGAGGNNA